MYYIRFAISSPISLQPTNVIPSDIISIVRMLSSRTFWTAASTASASLSKSNEYLSIIAADKIVAIASVDGKEQTEYTNFDVKFTFKEGKSFDTTKKYKLAIVCSSSKDGDKFSGAPGSVLYVDDLEVTF